MSNALMMAIIGTLRPVPAAATGIMPVGSKATPQLVSFTSGQLSGNATFALPPGCVAGDTATISCVGYHPSSGFSWSAPAGSVVALGNATVGSVPVSIYIHVLTQTDIDAGAVSVPCTLTTSGSWDIAVAGIVDVDRGVSVSAVDVVGTYTTGSLATGANTVTAPAITTTKAGDIVRYCLFSTAIPNTLSLDQPSGYAPGDTLVSAVRPYVATSHLAQPTAGPTGDAAGGLSYSASTGDYWGAVLLALRPKAPAIALTYDLPATATVGTAYSGSVAATLVDGATGPVAITATPLPDGVTAGTQVDNGDGSYTLPIEGTPTTAQTVDIDIGATNGTQSASATQSVVVSEAASGPAFVKGNTRYEGAAVLSTTVWFDDNDHTAHATAGNRLFAHFITISSRYANPVPAGWTLLASQKGTGAVAIQLFTKISDGTETSVTLTSSATYNKGGTLTEWTPSKVGSITSGVLALASTAWTGGPTDAPAYPTSVPLFGYNYQIARNGDTPTAPWVGQCTNKSGTVSGGGAYINGGYGYQPAPNAAVTFAATSPLGSASDGAWINVWIDPQ